KDTLQWHEYLNRALTCRKAMQYQDAVAYYQKALAMDSTYAETHYQLGQCYYAMTDGRKAQSHFLSAKDFDVIRFRAPSIFNTSIARVVQDHQALFADCENAFMKRSPQGIIGKNLLLEHVHPNLSGHLLIAKTIAETMAKNSLISAQWDSNGAKSDSVYVDMCHLTLLDHEVANYTLYRLMSQWPFPHKTLLPAYQRIGNEKTEELAKSLVDDHKKSLVELHLDYGNEFHQANQFQQALDEYTAALAIHPLTVTYDCLGRLYLRQTELAFRNMKDYDSADLFYQKGVFYFKEGLERGPQDVEMNFNLGLLYFMRANETDAAVKQFLQVLELSPKHNKAHRLLSEIYIRRQEFAKAKTYLQEAIELFPDDAYFYTNMGVVLLEENDLAGSERYLKQALHMDGNAKAKYYLGILQKKSSLQQGAL
ncbi:MAG: tetratricopeptide repeat protein, partial [Calditrichaeota bacterium]